MMQGYNNGYNNGYNAQPNQIGMRNNIYNSYGQQQAIVGKLYVNGRAGADAYPMPMGVNEIVLWDSESPRFYLKGYDNNGIPRVLEDNDYTPHIQPEVLANGEIDLSKYATKDDIKAMIAEAFSNAVVPSMSGYVTRQEMENEFSGLCLGEGGRIVRSNVSK